MNRILLSKNARKQIKKLPVHITRKLQRWSEQVEILGIDQIRKQPGYHDEPLKADRAGQRSIRLSKAYRAFYIEHDDKIIIEVIEVNKHGY